MSMRVVDVLIIGGSMAGSCLARNLKIKHPQLKITVLEKKKKFDHGIGESMLEIFWDYASRDLGLSKYLESNYYYKHGLRFFFEKDDKNTSLNEMSEMGRTWYHPIPAHQINRAKFDEDLIELNSKIDIETKKGTTVTDIEIGDTQKSHIVHTTNGQSYQCKWLIDASGLSSVLSKQLRDVEKLEGHPISAAWMRVQNLRELDELGDHSWRQRVNFTNRSLSTNHFMYRGYWVWLIPLDSTTFSIGVVWHHEKSNVHIKSQSDMEQFLLTHKWAQELFGNDYTVTDFGALKNIARISKTIFSAQRWFRTGMAAGFIDPLFSSGSAWLTDINRMICDIITSDIANKKDEVKQKVAGYDLYAHWWYDNFLLHITGNYHGNYELHKVLFKALLMDYFGIVMPASIGEYWKNFANISHKDMNQIRDKLKKEIHDNGAGFSHKIKDQLSEFLLTTGDPLEKNIRNFHDVELPAEYMANSLRQNLPLNDCTLKETRKKIEVETLLEASKVIAQRQGQKITHEILKKISKDYLNGKIENLTQIQDLLKD